MTQNVAQDRHRELELSAEEMTVRLGTLFEELCHWAVYERQEHVLEVSYHILGLNNRIMGIPNLVKEISFPESLEILEDWSDSLIASDLLRFSEAFNYSVSIQEHHQPLGHGGSAKRTKAKFQDVSKRTFLLALTAHPLAKHHQADITKLRRALRLWLILHAADRLLRFECPADSDISAAARYLIIDSSDEHWGFIDPLLMQVQLRLQGKENSFQRFNNALKNTTNHAYEHRAGKGSEYSKFLRSIQRIANGLCDPISTDSRTELRIPHLQRRWPSSDIAPESFAVEDITYQVISIQDDEESEEGNDFLLADIDPTDTPAQQTLRSGSVLIQTTELSHYLPWSWERLLPPEAKALDQWVTRSLSSTELESRLGAAYAWLAMTLSRSMQFLERVSIGPRSSQEWTFSADFHQLERSAPRRHSSWKPNEANHASVAPLQEKLTLNTPNWIRLELIQASQKLPNPPTSLGELWNGNVEISPERWFSHQMVGHLERVTSAKLANRKAQTIFDETGDYRLARLLTSHPQSALPGACSYATWDFSMIEKGLGLTFHDKNFLPENLNVIGSRLVPLEEVLTSAVSKANEKLSNATKNGLIHYHNTLAQYVVMALYAATGARPLRDPFDSAGHFGLDLACVYIDDKNDEGLHSGRLTPLPDQAVLLVRHYHHHLYVLAKQVTQHRPTLANEVDSLAKGLPAHMPLFFLLDQELKWHSMGDVESVSAPLFEWPLPANLFRHRYTQYLSSAGVDPEVIEGWMGHAERGLATYHDYSPRCWVKDANDYKSAVNDAYDCLHFRIPAETALPIPLIYSPASKSKYSEPNSFGAKARKRQRKHRLHAAIRSAKDDISVFLGDRAIDELDDSELVELSKQMLLRTNHLPHPQAAIRYRVLAKLIERSSISPSRRFRKRMVTIEEERSRLAPTVIRSLNCMPLLRAWAKKTRLSAQRSALSRTKALCVGAALLGIEKRLSYTRLLLDVTRGESYRVVQSGKQFFFEYNESLSRTDFRAPVQRHEISYKTASLLAYGQGRTQSIALPPPDTITELDELVSCYKDNSSHTSPVTCDEFFKWLSDTIDQCNLVELPGMVSAGHSQRLPPTSPSWPDQLRLTQGQRVQRPEGKHSRSNSESPLEALNRSRRPESDKLILQTNAKRFVGGIRDRLKDYRPSNALAIAKVVEKWCADNRSNVSTTLMLLGFWLVATIKQGKAPTGRKFKPYALNSLTTYWSSLSSAFEQLTYQVDLIALDEESVTELCEKLVEYKRQTSTNTSFFGERLSGFFQWAQQFGVESPAWGELDIDGTGRTVSPGLISENDYLDTLSHIDAERGLDSDQKLMMGFVLLCAYRFGLRAREAIALLGKDLCQNSETTWLLVRNNAYRALKSTASRRAVPLVFKVNPHEERLIETVVARYRSLCGNETHRPLLCETDDNLQTRLTCIASQLSASLIIAIRASTGNTDLVLHHCRHTFYNRMAAALLGLQTPIAQSLTLGVDTERLQRWVLGNNTNCSRRVGMALARLMGHWSPRTGLLNYFHLLTEWSDQLTPVTHHKVRTIPSVHNLGSWPAVQKSSLPEQSLELTYPKPSLVKVFQTLRLVSLGQSFLRAGTALRLRPDWIIALESVFQQANNLQSFKSDGEKGGWLDGKDCPNALLESVTQDAWQRIIHHANEIDRVNSVEVSNNNHVSLEELPKLVSKRRHLVFDEHNHINLIRHVLELFIVPEEQYQVYSRFDDEEFIEILLNSGFSVESEYFLTPAPKNSKSLIKKKVSLHGFPIYSRRHARYSHGEIILHRAALGILRSSFDLSIALLALGLFISMSAPLSSPVNEHILQLDRS